MATTAPRQGGHRLQVEAGIATEIELRLAARRRDLPTLTRAIEARATAAAEPPVKLVSTYFDTADRILLRQGLVLRVREQGGHFVQTVKCEKQDGDAGLRRGEWEDTIGSPEPDVEASASGRFLAPVLAGRLVPLFRTVIDRRTIELSPAPGMRIEAAVDRGRICLPDGEAGEPLGEIELELKGGEATALYDIALDLLAVAPLRVERRSKAERGYRLAAPEKAAPAAVHASAVELDPAMNGDDALRRIGIACLDQLLRNEPAVLAGVAEGVHQMRVAVRRLRAILSGFGRMLPADQRRRASQELRWLADALSPARNLDVFENALLSPARGKLADPDALAALAAATERRRRAAYAKAVRAVRSRRYTELLLRLLRWFEGRGWRAGAAATLHEPIAAVTARVLDRRRRVATRRGRGFAKQSPQDRHRLRIALKKLRYATEMLAGLYDPRAVERFIKRLKRLQDDLGDANDLRVARDIIAELSAPRRGGAGRDAAAIARAGEALLRWHERRLARREPRLREHLDGLLAAEPFWRR